MLDGGYVTKKLPQQRPDENDIYNFALACVHQPTEELFRIFYYHCAPYEKHEYLPISGAVMDFGASPQAAHGKSVLSKLAQKNYVAVRKGQLRFRGWSIKKFVINRLQSQAIQQTIASASQVAASTQTNASALHQNSLLTDSDFSPDFTQKEVDIKIGLDVAWLSSKRIVDKIILITGDTDFIPAMKFARREGVQVVIANILTSPTQNNYLKSELLEHADEVRNLSFQSNTWMII